LFEDNFIAAMDDDFNTSQAVAVIFDFVKEVNRAIAENDNINTQFYTDVKTFLERTSVGVLGIMNFDVEMSTAGKDIDVNLIEQMIEQRSVAKKEKNYSLADEIRNKLKELGVELKDSKEGTTYKIVK
jgi:cysteinyl-tRNA synthetase